MRETLTVSRSARLLQEEVADELVALDVEGGAFFGFNSSAKFIWQLIEQPRTVGEIRDALLLEFEIDRQTCEEELMEVLTQLQAAKLVSVMPTL